MLLEPRNKAGLPRWHAHGRSMQGLLLVRRGDVNAEARDLRPALDELRETRFSFHHTGFLAALAEGLGSAGRVTEDLAAIDEAIERSERTEERGRSPKCCRTRVSFSCCRVRRTPPRPPRNTSSGPRLGSPPGTPIVGTARRHESCSAFSSTGPDQPGAKAPGARLRPVHRGLRNRRSDCGEGRSRSAARADRTPSSSGAVIW